MTWIIGTRTLFGHSILVSDIRVTFSDGTERDCLRKMYLVGEDFLCGFAGSLRIGFVMMGALLDQLPDKRHLPLALLADDWIPSHQRFKNPSLSVRGRWCFASVKIAVNSKSNARQNVPNAVLA